MARRGDRRGGGPADEPGAPSSVRVYRDSLGHWYASFVVAIETQPLPATDRALGVDWGVKETATTTSDAHGLPHAQHGRTAARRLAKYQRMMARRKPKNGVRSSGGAGGVTEALAEAAGLISWGKLHIPVEKSYTLVGAAAAHIDSQAGHTRGRRVVIV